MSLMGKGVVITDGVGDPKPVLFATAVCLSDLFTDRIWHAVYII